VLPEETAYFPTVLTKYAPRGRRAQFDYLTKQSLSNVLFGGHASGVSGITLHSHAQKFFRQHSRVRHLIPQTLRKICLCSW